jgi:hypothetical protein
VSFTDLTLTCSEGAVYLHDVELTESEFALLARIADLFRENDPGGYTPAMLVARAPGEVEDGDWCHHCGGQRPSRRGNVR